MSEIKSVSNNDVADIGPLDQKKLAFRTHDRAIMSTQATDEGVQLVSIGKNGPQWTGDPEQAQQQKSTLWDFTACNLPFTWTHYGIRGEGVNVFVLDTGIDVYHPVFAHCSSKLVAKSFVPGLPSPEDGSGHGTWVCGKIVGSGVGLAPACNLSSLRVLDDSGSGRTEFTTRALEWILKQDMVPHVINMSLGSAIKSTEQEKLIWQLYKKGAIIVVAAGNEGEDDSKFYPAAYSGVLAIGAVDKQKVRADFSNYGANIAVCAPGVSCYSAYPGGSFRLLQGTSMAAPTVAGLITLGLSYALSKGKKAGVELRDQIVQSLELSSKDLGEKGRDPYYGFGCIDGQSFFEKLDSGLQTASVG